MLAVFFIFIFVLGSIIGSFLNVVAFRYNSGISINGRSFCPNCGKKLSWYELVPIFSFLIQRGKCLKCKSKISWQYPIVEIITGLMFLGVGYKFPSLFEQADGSGFYLLGVTQLLYYWFIFSILIAITVYDIKHKIIPDGLVFLFIFMAFLRIFLDFETGKIISPSTIDLLTGPLLALPFASLWFFSGGRWMGFGDAKLALGIGWMLGMVLGLSTIVLSFWIGAFFSIVLIGLTNFNKIKNRFTFKSEIPFAPFLVFSTFIIFLSEYDLLNIGFFIL